ncbi:UDP-galactopyranose mutase [Allocatelliglobosispora scoriae]|uniref:UDP-galactopyranose mutase n=1 Tax=Allocatelliglobosispora scoriae TaxID=643052 RepID=A0A841C341_9ACTN|nr:UDP-galactopyranose mutase [Allocatelliglobosispora scoriae]MBB5874178.1 UDP-galactopyranose mutase [Allocatelliglobosispora scoriae]
MALVRVIGAGLAGAAVAHLLHRAGRAVEVVEGDPTWGGQLRTASAAGVLYEPAGAHIFHTADTEVWELVTSLVPMLPYRHVVRTEAFDRVLSWPPQLAELRELPGWAGIERELAARPAVPRADNFESWCVGLMGETLYHEFIEGYTRKQWGEDPKNLTAAWAPKRIELRDDGYTDLFRDPHQGWPDGGYPRLVDGLLRGVPVVMGQRITIDDWDDVCAGADAVVITCALDEFFAEHLGRLPWRGVRLVNHYLPGVDHVLPCGVLNTPSPLLAHTRAIETKWMSGQTGPGTVVSYEYPGAPARHYPIDDVAGANRALARRYLDELHALPGPPRYVAGRLATYAYIDMDQVIRQAMNITRRVLDQLTTG